MSESSIKGFVYGTIGLVLGGLSWLILCGVAIGSIVYVAIPGIACLILLSLSTLLYYRTPDWRFQILGINLLIVSCINYFIGNIIYKQIPERAFGFAVVRDGWNINDLNIWFFYMSIFGLILTIYGLVKTRQRV